MPFYLLKVKRETKATSKSGRINYPTCSRNLVRRTCLTANCNTSSSTWRWTDTFRKASSQRGTKPFTVSAAATNWWSAPWLQAAPQLKCRWLFILHTSYMNPIISHLLACWFIAMGGYHRAACLQRFLEHGFQAEPGWFVLFKYCNSNFKLLRPFWHLWMIEMAVKNEL